MIKTQLLFNHKIGGMAIRPNVAKKKAYLEELRLVLKRKRFLGLLSYLRKGCFDLKNILAQSSIREQITSLENQRYLTRSMYRANDFTKMCNRYLYTCWLTPSEFRRMFGMSRCNFWKLEGLICGHEVFQRGKRGPSQYKPAFQLLVLLAYMRTEGNGMCNEAARNIFLVGSGTCEKMRERVVDAIYGTLRKDAIFWPDEEERKVIAKSFHDNFDIPNVTAIMDGTLLGLAFTPIRDDSADFKGRKGSYTLTCLVVNDHKRRIRYYHLGWPGSTHDDRVLSNSWLASNWETAFGTKGIALGDCAYAPRAWVVPAFKKPVHGTLPDTKHGFNTLLARPRVTSEHTIGMLKNRFPFLRSIRIKLTEKQQSMQRIQKYVAVAIILHNLLIGWQDDDWECDDDSSVATDVEEENELNRPVQDDSTSDERRSQLFSYYLEYLA